MKTKQNRSMSTTAYITSGNLALAPVQAPVFTVIEGGRSTHNLPDLKTVRAERRAREAEESRMRVRSLAVFITLICVLVAASVLGDAYASVAKNKAFASIETTYVTVEAGDSLWAIAESHPVEGRSTRDVTSWIKKTNGLSSATIMVGQVLVVPAS